MKYIDTELIKNELNKLIECLAKYIIDDKFTVYGNFKRRYLTKIFAQHILRVSLM